MLLPRFSKYHAPECLVLPKIKFWKDLFNISKRGGKDGVFQGLAGHGILLTIAIMKEKQQKYLFEI